MECIGCGAEFQPRRSNQKRCRKNCGRSNDSMNGARAERRKAPTEFIAVDGEGVDGTSLQECWDEELGDIVWKRVNSHNYVMLSVGDQTLENDGKPLTHDEIFDFLWQQYLDHPNAAFVGFFLGYDFTQWLKSLPEKAAWQLLHKDGIAARQGKGDNHYPYPIRLRDWEIDILGTKRFKLRPRVYPSQIEYTTKHHRDGTVTMKKKPRPWMNVCDAGPFFQSSLMSAINPKKWPDSPIVTEREYELLSEGKAHRDCSPGNCHHGWGDDCPGIYGAAMRRYNLLENDVLARLMSRLDRGFRAIGVYLKRSQWMGPGQAAQAWLGLVGCPKSSVLFETLPEWARDVGWQTYYGGWPEIFAHGLIPGTTYSYDVNSAYPAAIAELPCLLHGHWSRGEAGDGQKRPKARGRAIQAVRATVEGFEGSLIGPMPHRGEGGEICRPITTTGWYWVRELEASKRAGLLKRIVKYHEWVHYEPCDCPPPLAAIRELYDSRLLAGAPEGATVDSRTPEQLKISKESCEGKAKKLVFNSTYGKLAQSVGSPVFTSGIWASLITSDCRCRILDAIATHPDRSDAVVMVATDSVTFLTRHPNLELSPTKLGAWDETTHENLSLFMPGVYWDDDSRAGYQAGKSNLYIKSRGVSAADLADHIEEIDREWEEFSRIVQLEDRGERRRLMKDPPSIDIPIRFSMVSAKLAITRGKWWLAGDVVKGGVRRISAEPWTKRCDVAGLYPVPSKSPGNPGILRSYPWYRAALDESVPYEKRFGDDHLFPGFGGVASGLETPEAPTSHVAVAAVHGE